MVRKDPERVVREDALERNRLASLLTTDKHRARCHLFFDQEQFRIQLIIENTSTVLVISSGKVTPVPIPNTVVKLTSADGSWA